MTRDEERARNYLVAMLRRVYQTDPEVKRHQAGACGACVCDRKTFPLNLALQVVASSLYVTEGDINDH